MEISTHVFSNEGHRQSYLSILSGYLTAHGLTFTPPHKSAAASFFPMIEDNVPRFVVAAIICSIRKKPCVGLLFRPSECLRTDSLKYRFKGLLFRLLKKLPSVSVLTILPFSVEQAFAEVATGWIYDPQLWDLPDQDPGPIDTELKDRIARAAQGRKLVIALGVQNRIKGFEFFARLWCEKASLRERYLFVAAGKVAIESADLAVKLTECGGIIVNRFISDEELLSLYEIGDVIWACYAPDYNQASGIFGRSFQLAKNTIVRRGSHLVPLAAELGHPVLPIPFDENDEAANFLLSHSPIQRPNEHVAETICSMRDRDIRVLISAFNGQRCEF